MAGQGGPGCVCVCVCVCVSSMQFFVIHSVVLGLPLKLNKGNIGGGTFAIYLHALPKETCGFKLFNAADV